MTRTAYELAEKVRASYTGAQRNFVMARLALRAGFDLAGLAQDDADPEKLEKLRQAVRELALKVSP